MPYERRTYRRRIEAEGLFAFGVKVGETDLQVLAERDLSDVARELVREARREIESYAEATPGFLDTLEPMTVSDNAPPIVRRMAEAAALAGTGPMAAVAGAISERVGEGLLAPGEGAPATREVIVENGGDVFMKTSRSRRVAVFAGQSGLSMKLAIEIDPDETPLGICTSSGTVGPSTSFGRADAAVVIAPNVALADAVATALGNRVRAKGDLAPALEWALSIEGVRGALVVLGDAFAAQGEVRLAQET